MERVARHVRAAALDARLEEFPGGTPTAESAADAIGCDLSQIVKSLVFVCDGEFVVALVPGDRRASAAKVARAAHADRARIGAPDDVRAATGFEPGAVAPFPLRAVDRVLMESTLLIHDKVWVGAGSPSHLAALAPGELVRLTQARAADLVERLPEPGGVSDPRHG